METRYTIDSKDKVRIWNCWAGKDVDGNWGVFTQDGLLDGKLKEATHKQSKEMNIGKSNYLSTEDQAHVMVTQAITKKEKKDYFKTIEEAQTTEKLFLPTGCPSGMKWSEWKDKSHIVYPALASGKLDGSKLVMLKREGRAYSQTRSGKEHKNFRHFEQYLEQFFEDYPNLVLDGEAYNHEYRDRFEDLQSIFKKQTPTEEQRKLSKDVSKFYVYDVIDKNKPDLTAEERQNLLSELFSLELAGIDSLVYWPSHVVNSEAEFDEFHNQMLEDGFEGSILKISDAPYVCRKNKFVLKRKEVFDAEFKIIDIIEGEGTKAGVAGKVIISLVHTDGMNDSDFAKLVGETQEAGMGAGLDNDACRAILDNKEEYIGQMATVEYFGITKHGKCRFPKYKSIRND
tara:strand:- start:2208 stop:3404 length:1197 start_codon:yes stop_codon:yes gene_type:complete